MSEELNSFRNYVMSSGVDFDSLTNNEKGEWRVRFDYRPQGKNSLYSLVII